MFEGFGYLAAAVGLSLADHLAHRPGGEVHNLIRRWITHRDRAFLDLLATKRRHILLTLIPFVSCWLYILFALAISRSNHYFIPLSILILASQLRALQEVSHFAVHGALHQDRSVGFFLSDIFFHFPVMRPSSADRYVSHVQRHHRHSNTDRDPNVAELVRAGLGPAMNRGQFFRLILHPISLGAVGELLAKKAAMMSPQRGGTVWLRWVALVVSVSVIWVVGGMPGLIFVYVPTVLLLYPQLAWLSQLIEHRWLSPRETPPSVNREYAHGRATDFPGLSGALVRVLVLPRGDSYHLAHSLFPFVRWNYLPAVDAVLKQSQALYLDDRSIGLFTNRHDAPAAIDVIQYCLGEAVDGAGK